LEYRPFSSQRLLALPPLFLTRLISLTAAALPSKLKDLLALLLSKNPQGSSWEMFFSPKRVTIFCKTQKQVGEKETQIDFPFSLFQIHMHYHISSSDQSYI